MEKKLIGAQLDTAIIEQIDAACRQAGINRSEFLRRAIQQQLNQQTGNQTV